MIDPALRAELIKLSHDVISPYFSQVLGASQRLRDIALGRVEIGESPQTSPATPDVQANAGHPDANPT